MRVAVTNASGNRSFVIGREEVHDSRHLVGRAEALYRHLAQHHLFGFRGQLIEKPRLDDAGRDPVDANAVVNHLLAESLRERNDPGLRHGVRDQLRRSLFAGDGGNADDGAGPRLAHRADHHTRDEESAGQVHRHHGSLGKAAEFADGREHSHLLDVDRVSLVHARSRELPIRLDIPRRYFMAVHFATTSAFTRLCSWHSPGLMDTV